MIIPNGTVEFISRSAGGIDEHGYPVAATATYGNPVPCQYVANTFDYLGKSEGERFIRAAYSILVETVLPFGLTENLRLKDRDGRPLGDYSVLRFEPLDAVCQLRILV